MGVLTYSPLAGGWLSGGYRKGREIAGPGSPARRAALRRAPTTPPRRPTPPSSTPPTPSARSPTRPGSRSIQMAIAFVVRHPAVTSAIVGPRTMEHLDSYLAADGVDLSDDVLDRIDEIVAPGHTVNVADNMWSTSTTALDPGSGAVRAAEDGAGRTG